MKPQFIIISGTNGSGKSSFGEQLNKTIGIPFIDTDSLYKAKYGEYRNYTQDELVETSKEISKLRDFYFSQKTSFAVEKILSNEKEIKHLINKAKENGFLVSLVYIGLDKIHENNARILNRHANEGKHFVKSSLVKENLDLSIQTFNKTAYFFDNVLLYKNQFGSYFEKIYDKRGSETIKKTDKMPTWACKMLLSSAEEKIAELTADKNTNLNRG
jgi:predicted ABC-type ATPase